MNPILPVAVVLAALSASPVLSKPKGHCPPGLAKKAVPCVPPGYAKKGASANLHHFDDGFVYRRGDNYRDDGRYRRVRDYDRYGLPRLREGEIYYGNGSIVYRVDRETRRVLDLIRLVDLTIGD